MHINIRTSATQPQLIMYDCCLYAENTLYINHLRAFARSLQLLVDYVSTIYRQKDLSIAAKLTASQLSLQPPRLKFIMPTNHALLPFTRPGRGGVASGFGLSTQTVCHLQLLMESVTSTSIFGDSRISTHADPTSTRRANLIGTRLQYFFPP